VYAIGRVIYGISYRTSGAGAREAGVAILDLALIVLLILSVLTCWEIIGGLSGFTKVLTSLVTL